MIHTTYKLGDPEQTMKISVGGAEARLNIWTVWPPDNAPEDEEARVHVKISDPR